MPTTHPETRADRPGPDEPDGRSADGLGEQTSTTRQSPVAATVPSRTDAPTGSGTFVFAFEDGNKDLKDLLGGKGANLAEMTNLGLPVPPGFTITTEACRWFLLHDAEPAELAAEMEDHLCAHGGDAGPPARRSRTTRCWSRCAPGRSSRCRG